MRKTAFTLLTALLFSVSMFNAPVFSQDVETPVYTTTAVPQEAETPVYTTAAALVPEEGITDSQFTYGTVVSVSQTGITISEYDFETDTSSEVAYDVAADVKLENVASMQDLKEGDEVELEFVMENGKGKVISIYVE